MAGLDHSKLGMGPDLSELPGGIDGTAEVETAVDEYAGNASNPMGAVEELILVQPGVVVEVVGDEPGEGHAEGRIVVAGIWEATRQG